MTLITTIDLYYECNKRIDIISENVFTKSSIKSYDAKNLQQKSGCGGLAV